MPIDETLGKYGKLRMNDEIGKKQIQPWILFTDTGLCKTKNGTVLVLKSLARYRTFQVSPNL